MTLGDEIKKQTEFKRIRAAIAAAETTYKLCSTTWIYGLTTAIVGIAFDISLAVKVGAYIAIGSIVFQYYFKFKKQRLISKGRKMVQS